MVANLPHRPICSFSRPSLTIALLELTTTTSTANPYHHSISYIPYHIPHSQAKFSMKTKSKTQDTKQNNRRKNLMRIFEEKS
ncbi:unnamed protein product [Tuber melanosporum]|uniref:(Perigord truffle) hypothetical protein n=1 Tax=Tuber melanosporum (strain Mel28) TaxID=656061 RepID=D5GJ19_TUBMM|nr:uncharacterized protein GSTUM_00008783001 [Tuber melanosporum]CAZ84512.1 unnamed protein product [Tuber melanosporum]